MLENFIKSFIIYFGVIDPVGCAPIFLAIILMIMSITLFTLEIQIANLALDVYLSDLEKHQECKDYFERKKSRRKSTSKVFSDQSPS